jgi:hypothetical protein
LITFFNKNKGIGGGENLIINLSAYFYLQLQITTKVICYKDSYIYKRLNELQVSFIFIDMEQNNFDHDLTAEDVVIKTDPENLNWFKNSKAKILYWEILPTVLANTINPNKKLLYKQKLLSYLLNSGGLVFMDSNGVEELRSRGYILKEFTLLPIPAAIPAVNKEKKVADKDHLTITYLGRADNWKIYPFKKVLDDLAQLDQMYQVIIFCNDEIPYKKIIQNTGKKIAISYYINKYGEELEALLYKNSDCHFAMGTSAIDSAKMGIPTILLDYSDNIFPEDYQYQFIFEAKGFSLGNDVTRTDYTNQRKSIAEVFDCISSPEKYAELSTACYEYVNAHHNIKTIAVSLFEKATHSTASISKAHQYFCYGSYESKLRKIL